jgi:hypothetical protein
MSHLAKPVKILRPRRVQLNPRETFRPAFGGKLRLPTRAKRGRIARRAIAKRRAESFAGVAAEERL